MDLNIRSRRCPSELGIEAWEFRVDLETWLGSSTWSWERGSSFLGDLSPVWPPTQTHPGGGAARSTPRDPAATLFSRPGRPEAARASVPRSARHNATAQAFQRRDHEAHVPIGVGDRRSAVLRGAPVSGRAGTAWTRTRQAAGSRSARFRAVGARPWGPHPHAGAQRWAHRDRAPPPRPQWRRSAKAAQTQ